MKARPGEKCSRSLTGAFLYVKSLLSCGAFLGLLAALVSCAGERVEVCFCSIPLNDVHAWDDKKGVDKAYCRLYTRKCIPTHCPFRMVQGVCTSNALRQGLLTSYT
jgi:hypothetical protein